MLLVSFNLPYVFLRDVRSIILVEDNSTEIGCKLCTRYLNSIDIFWCNASSCQPKLVMKLLDCIANHSQRIFEFTMRE